MDRNEPRPPPGITGKALWTGLAVLAVTSGSAAAQSVSQLEARIDRLEAEARDKNNDGGTISTATGIDLTFYGYVRADMYYDNKHDMGPNTIGFGTVTSATPENDHFGANAYHTRFGIRGRAHDVSFNLESDFYGGGGGSLRIRHAYVEYAGFTLGQTWTNMASLGPGMMLDINGGPSFPGHRVVQARYTFQPADGLKVSFSAEDDILPWRARPVLTGAVSYTNGENAYRFSAMSRGLEDLAGNTVNGWGVSASTQMTLWEGGILNAVVSTGKGISSMMNGGGGVGQQAGQTTVRSTYDIDENDKPIGMNVYAVGISQALNPQLELGLAVGYNDYDDFSGSTPTSVRSLSGSFLTLKYKPKDNLLLGLEYSRFERKEFGGGRARNDRIMTVAQFSF